MSRAAIGREHIRKARRASAAPTYRVTLPALMQEVQTFRRFGLPATVARTRWIFGSQRRLVFFFDQGTLWPKPGPFPQMSHTAATGVHFHSIAI